MPRGLNSCIRLIPTMFAAVFDEATLDSANMEACDAETASFRKASMGKARLDNAILREADFSEADLSKASFREANIDDAVFEGALLGDTLLDHLLQQLLGVDPADLDVAVGVAVEQQLDALAVGPLQVIDGQQHWPQLVQPVQQPQERGLARAAGTDQRHLLPRTDLQR